MEVFEECHLVNELLAKGLEREARDQLIKILDWHEKNRTSYSALVNHLIRQTGLYPYLQTETSAWSDRFAYESFKTAVGESSELPLHREQSLLLKRLVDGESLAVSAPTSFGKSFVIDAFIAMQNPANVVIVVPTIALTDETRRRLQRKFSSTHKIITTSDVSLGARNILIFPQERAIGYLETLKEIDFLVVDEFYKASPKFDKERSPALLKTILKLSAVAKQRYFLAPNISRLNASPFTEGMDFVELDFNTVYLQKHELYREILGDEKKKSEALLRVLKSTTQKSLIYAGTYSSIESVSNLLVGNLEPEKNPLLEDFSNWLSVNYGANWNLVNLVRRATGVHNGQLHRALSQIQVRLFEEDQGLRNLISTSSIVEGVNTCAKNVVIWKSKNGASNLNDFTYRNIIGRGGRMFKHFVGEIYILDKPPDPTQNNLDLEFPDSLLGDLDEVAFKQALTQQQIAKIIAHRETMGGLIGKEVFARAIADGSFQSSDTELIQAIATGMKTKPDEWNGLGFLNSEDPDDWDRLLYKIINLRPGVWETQYAKYVAFIKILSKNWFCTIPELLNELDGIDISVNDFFKLERNATFKLAGLMSDVNAMQKLVLHNPTDISPFVARLSNAFLPRAVYELEEYGLPRMIAKKINNARLLDLENPELTLHSAIEQFLSIGLEGILSKVKDLDSFDEYLLSYFFEGINGVNPSQ